MKYRCLFSLCETFLIVFGTHSPHFPLFLSGVVDLAKNLGAGHLLIDQAKRLELSITLFACRCRPRDQTHKVPCVEQQPLVLNCWPQCLLRVVKDR